MRGKRRPDGGRRYRSAGAHAARVELLAVGADLAAVFAALLAVAPQLAAILTDLAPIAAQLAAILSHIAVRRVLSADDRADDDETDRGGDDSAERDDLHGSVLPTPHGCMGCARLDHEVINSFVSGLLDRSSTDITRRLSRMLPDRPMAGSRLEFARRSVARGR